MITRSNVGNIITNGLQTLSVAATTGVGMFKGDAARQLNNRTSGYSKLSKEEQTQLGKIRANKLRNEILEGELNEEFNIDNLMAENSPQSNSITQKIREDMKYQTERDNIWKDIHKQFTKEETEKNINQLLEE